MLLLVKVKPGAHKDAVRAWDPDTLTLDLTVAAPPVGAGNTSPRRAASMHRPAARSASSPLRAVCDTRPSGSTRSRTVSSPASVASRASAGFAVKSERSVYTFAVCGW